MGEDYIQANGKESGMLFNYDQNQAFARKIKRKKSCWVLLTGNEVTGKSP